MVGVLGRPWRTSLGADSQDVLFSGHSMSALVSEDSTKILLVLVVAKALGYGICLGCGFRGGPVLPPSSASGLVMFAVVWFDVSPTLAVAVGTAAGMAAMTKLLVAPAPLRRGCLWASVGVDAVPAAVLAACAAWVVTAGLERRVAPQAAVEPCAS